VGGPLGCRRHRHVICPPRGTELRTKSRTTSQSTSIINNLRQLDGAKQQWAIENHKSANDEPTMKDLTTYLRSGGMQSIAGEKYVVGKIGDLLPRI